MEIFTIAPDGSDRRRLTHLPGNAYDASWSPNGRKIVFSRNAQVSPRGDLYVMPANGSHTRRLTRSSRRDNHNADWAVVPR